MRTALGRHLAAILGRAKHQLSAAKASWDKFWFAPSDPYALSLLRLLAGGMLLYSHLIWGLEFDAFFGPDGWNSAQVVRGLQQGTYAWSFWWHVPDEFRLLVHVVCCLVIFLFFIGCWTRITSVLSWLIAVSYAHRAMLANFGLDQILCMLTMYLMLAPCGEYLSFDAWRRRLKRGVPCRVRPASMATVSQRLVQLHLCVIYFFAGLSKLQGRSWWTGNAVWDAISNYEYQSLDLTFLAAFPFVVHFATHLTVLWEVTFATLVWNRRLRAVVLLIGVAMHVGIGLFLGMWTFGLAMTFGYLCFVPPRTLRHAVHAICRVPAAAVPDDDPLDQAASGTPLDGESSCGQQQPDGSPVSSPLVVVCRSVGMGTNVLRYFKRYGRRAFFVDGMVQARELSRCGDSIVIVMEPALNAEELRHWVRHIREVNPTTKFVFRTDAAEALPALCRTVNLRCNLRELRLACQSLLGIEMEERKPPVACSPPPRERLLTAEEENEMNAADQHADSTAADPPADESAFVPRIRKFPRVLLLAVLLAGCSSGRETAEGLLERAAHLNDAGRFDEALSLSKQAALQDPINAQACYLQGVSYEGLSQFEDARQAYSDCLERDERNADALNNRAVVLGKLHKIDAAIADLEQAVTFNPDDGLAWSNLGLAHHQKREFDEAVVCYDKAAKRSDDPRIAFQRGNAQLAASRYEEAIKDYTRAIDRDSRFAEAFLNRGIAHLRKGNDVAGAADLQQAERLDSDMSIASLARSIRESHAEQYGQAWARLEVRRWLALGGWEIQDVDGFPHVFKASRVPVAGPQSPASDGVPEPPDDFYGVVAAQHSEHGVLCEYKALDAAIKHAKQHSDLPHCLFVIDPELLAASADERTLRGFVGAEYDWDPTRASFTPRQVVLPPLNSPERSR